jgi:hypothetical protein
MSLALIVNNIQKCVTAEVFMTLAQIYINELVVSGALSDREAIEIVGELRGPCVSLLDFRAGLILLPQCS